MRSLSAEILLLEPPLRMPSPLPGFPLLPFFLPPVLLPAARRSEFNANKRGVDGLYWTVAAQHKEPLIPKGNSNIFLDDSLLLPRKRSFTRMYLGGRVPIAVCNPTRVHQVPRHSWPDPRCTS